MNRIEELIKVLDKQVVRDRSFTAKGNRVCKICGKSAVIFLTDRAELEYSISSICQSCQDYYLSDYN